MIRKTLTILCLIGLLICLVSWGVGYVGWRYATTYAAGFAALACYFASPILHRRKCKKLGLCLKCGYDLRGSKDICPECGEEFGSTGVEG